MEFDGSVGRSTVCTASVIRLVQLRLIPRAIKRCGPRYWGFGFFLFLCLFLKLDRLTCRFVVSGGAPPVALGAQADGVGLRASEVIALKVSDIDDGPMSLRVEQGNEPRTATRCSVPCCYSDPHLVAHRPSAGQDPPRLRAISWPGSDGPSDRTAA
jgi:hypothetical protein